MPITGHCLCGTVAFAIDPPPPRASYCHCTRCQRRSGTAASAQATLEPGSLRFTAGEERVKGWQPPDGFAKYFCEVCGGQLFSGPPGEEYRGVRLGALDPGHGLRPQLRQYVEYAAEWEPLPDDGLPCYEEGRPR